MIFFIRMFFQLKVLGFSILLLEKAIETVTIASVGRDSPSFRDTFTYIFMLFKRKLFFFSDLLII